MGAVYLWGNRCWGLKASGRLNHVLVKYGGFIIENSSRSQSPLRHPLTLRTYLFSILVFVLGVGWFFSHYFRVASSTVVGLSALKSRLKISCTGSDYL